MAMTYRHFLFLLAFAPLAACKPAATDMTPEERDARPPVKSAELDTNEVACAIGGAKVFADVCAVERVRGKDGLMLVVRHPDGGFRRFAVLDDGRGVAVADGAEEASIAIDGDTIEIAVGDNRYRLPATVKPHATN